MAVVPTRETSVTQTLAAEISGTPATAIPRGAWDAIKRMVIDQVGITYMGAAFTGKPLFTYAKDLGVRAEAVLIGDGTRVPAELAAGINSQNCRTTDFEETGPGTHIGALVVHTALAVGQRAHASGRDVLAAATLGYVMGARFQFARLSHWPRTSALQHRTVAAGIASRLLGHDATMTARALSLAWEFPPRKHQTNDGYGTKRLSPFGSASGIAMPLFNARMGVQAATMAGFGFESAPDEIDQHLAEYDVPVLVDPVTPYHWVDGEMELKPWISPRHGQCGMQAIANLVRDHAIDPKTVTTVRLHLLNFPNPQWTDDPAPNTYLEAIYSTQWAASMILQRIPAGPKWVAAERLADPLSRHLAGLVSITVGSKDKSEEWAVGKDNESFAQARAKKNVVDWYDVWGEAEIDAGGRTFRTRCTMRETYGSPTRPMTEAMVEEKFVECASLTHAPEQARRLLEALRQIEDASDINDVANLF